MLRKVIFICPHKIKDQTVSLIGLGLKLSVQIPNNSFIRSFIAEYLKVYSVLGSFFY